MAKKVTKVTEIKHHGIGRRSEQFPDIHMGAVAERVGMSRAYLSAIINGGRRPSMDLAIKIAEVLGITVENVAAMYKEHKRNGSRQRPAA
jgi:transcriptional regulator with XRE-family HTH domain